MRIAVVIALIFSQLAFGSTTKSKGRKKKVAAKASQTQASSTTPKLQTDINFNDSVLHGRYQTPEEATARVENEKLLSDLLNVRTNFKDRLKRASEQN